MKTRMFLLGWLAVMAISFILMPGVGSASMVNYTSAPANFTLNGNSPATATLNPLPKEYQIVPGTTTGTITIAQNPFSSTQKGDHGETVWALNSSSGPIDWIQLGVMDVTQSSNTFNLNSLLFEEILYGLKIEFRKVGNRFNDATSVFFTLNNVNQVPIPAAAWLLGTGLIGLVAIRRRRK